MRNERRDQNSPHNLRNKRLLRPPFTIVHGEGPSSINHVLQRRVNRADLINLIIRGRKAPPTGRGKIIYRGGVFGAPISRLLLDRL